MSQARKKSVQDMEPWKQETTEMEYAKLLKSVKSLSAKIDEYLKRYPMADDTELPATTTEKFGLKPCYKADKPRPHSEITSSSNQLTDHRSISSIINSSSLPLSDDPHTTKDPKERPKRLRNSFKSDQTAAKIRKTSKQDEDILNADFIAL